MNRMMLTKTAVMATLIAAAGSALAQPVWFDAATAQAQIRQIQQASGVPSMSAAILRLDGGEAGVAASGVRRLGDPTPVTTADRYSIGSNAKAVTSTAIGHLVEAGRIRWDSTIGEVLGSEIPTLDASYRDVTLHDLLGLRGGTPPIFTFPEMEPYSHFPGTPTQQRIAVANAILSQPQAYPTGETVYSNAAYTIAAAMAEHVSGQTWSSMVHSQLTTRMGITFEEGWPGQDGSDQPWGHVDVDGDGVPDLLEPGSPFPVFPVFSPAGDLSMTMSDLALFGQQHLRALAGLDNTLGLDGATVADLHDNRGFLYASGWVGMDIFPGGFGEGWLGSTDAFSSILMIDAQRGFAVAVATNGNDAFGDVPSDAMIAAANAMVGAVIPAPGAMVALGGGLVVMQRRRRRGG